MKTSLIYNWGTKIHSSIVPFIPQRLTEHLFNARLGMLGSKPAEARVHPRQLLSGEESGYAQINVSQAVIMSRMINV